MAKSPSPARTLDVELILGRTAEVAGVSSDSDLARSLGVTPQTLSNWRARGTVPFERLCEFAARNDASLDFVVLGAGSRKRRSLDVDPHLLAQVWVALEVGLKNHKQHRDVMPIEKVFYAGLLYNKVSVVPDDGNRHDAIRREAEHLVAIHAGMTIPDALEVGQRLLKESIPRPSTDTSVKRPDRVAATAPTPRKRKARSAASRRGRKSAQH